MDKETEERIQKIKEEIIEEITKRLIVEFQKQLKEDFEHELKIIIQTIESADVTKIIPRLIQMETEIKKLQQGL